MGYKIITPPVVPFTAQQIRGFLRVDPDLETHPDDALILRQYRAAMRFAQHENECAVGAQVIEFALDAFPCGGIEVPLRPATNVVSIKYVDAAGQTQTIASETYTLDNFSPRHWILPAFGTDWPETLEVANAVVVRCEVGAASIPESVLSGIDFLVGHLYENRQEVTHLEVNQLPIGIRALISTEKEWGV